MIYKFNTVTINLLFISLFFVHWPFQRKVTSKECQWMRRKPMIKIIFLVLSIFLLSTKIEKILSTIERTVVRSTKVWVTKCFFCSFSSLLSLAKTYTYTLSNKQTKWKIGKRPWSWKQGNKIHRQNDNEQWLFSQSHCSG